MQYQKPWLFMMTKTTKNQINPNKLLLSKWTAVQPVNKEKHFLVAELLKDEQEQIIGCVLEAVINNRKIEMAWQELSNSENWLLGWR